MLPAGYDNDDLLLMAPSSSATLFFVVVWFVLAILTPHLLCCAVLGWIFFSRMFISVLLCSLYNVNYGVKEL